MCKIDRSGFYGLCGPYGPQRVLKTIWKPLKSKEHKILHQNYTHFFFSTPPKKLFFSQQKIFFLFFFQKSKNRKFSIFEISDFWIFSLDFSIFQKFQQQNNFVAKKNSFFRDEIFFPNIITWSKLIENDSNRSYWSFGIPYIPSNNFWFWDTIEFLCIGLIARTLTRAGSHRWKQKGESHT